MSTGRSGPHQRLVSGNGSDERTRQLQRTRSVISLGRRLPPEKTGVCTLNIGILLPIAAPSLVLQAPTLDSRVERHDRRVFVRDLGTDHVDLATA